MIRNIITQLREYIGVPMGEVKFERDVSDWKALSNEDKQIELPKCERIKRADLTFDEFKSNYLERNRPVIIEGGVNWPTARKEWGREFLKSKFGAKRQHVKLGRNGIFEGPARRDQWSDYKDKELPQFVRDKLDFPELVMERPGGVELSIGEIVDMFQNRTRDSKVDEWISAYIEYTPMSNHFDELKKELGEPDYFKELNLLHQNIWIGDGQTLGKMHFDEYENALAVVKGVKEVILFDPRQNQNLYEGHLPEARFTVERTANNGFTLNRSGLLESTSMVMSPVDILNPDFVTFPRFKRAKPMICRVEAGDVLFLPSFWWHEVQSYPDQDEMINIAVNFWYQPFFTKDFPCAECPLEFNHEAYRDLL